MMIFGVFGLIGLILLVTSFILPTCNDLIDRCSTSTKVILLVLGATFLGAFVFMTLIFMCMAACELKSHFKDLDETNTNQQPVIWRLDGEEWIRYLNYIYGPQRLWTDGDPASPFCCRRSSYDRLMDRQYGHIVLYGNGLIIDELYFVSFRSHTLQGIQILGIGEHQQTKGLRIHTYLKAEKNSRNVHFDVFAPSSVSAEQLQAIAQSYNNRIAGFDGSGLATDGLYLAATVLHALS